MVVERVGLKQVYDVETVGSPGHRVLDAEVVPLRVAVRVEVRLEDQVIFEFVDLDSAP